MPVFVAPHNQVALGRVSLAAVVALALALGTGGCGRKIGDSCTSSADCDPTTGSRTCDLSQPGGYCVIEGCDARSCPEDSFCVRFFPEPFLDPSMTQACATDADCSTDELCLIEVSGLCVRRSLEKRVCVQNCGDCRGGYECRMTGIRGAVALTLTRDEKRSYCAPADKP